MFDCNGHSRGVVRGGPLGPWPHLVFEAGLKTMGHTHGTHPWPHLVLEAGPNLGQKPYYPPDSKNLFCNLKTISLSEIFQEKNFQAILSHRLPGVKYILKTCYRLLEALVLLIECLQANLSSFG